MNEQAFRLSAGGHIDRSSRLTFTFDGRRYVGYAGDTLASALLANGVHLVGRSFKYHRPRGIFSAGSEEPSALVTLREGGRAEPNTRATTVELFDGLVAKSQNRWPSVRFDLMAVNNLLAPVLSAGFYYKTFMWPAGAWEKYEKYIRRAAGMGRATMLPDPDRYETANAFCDVLVVGAGPAGLAAAYAASRTGVRVTLVDESPEPGGALRFERDELGEEPASQWAARVVADLANRANVTVMTRTTAFGFFDGNTFGLLERVADHRLTPRDGEPRQRLWTIRAKKVVLATGAIERPLVFANNDLPGIMLAGAVRHYSNAYGVIAGRRIVIATNNDSAYRTARDLAEAGATVAAVVDARADARSPLVDEVLRRGIQVIRGSVVTKALGRQCVRGVELTATRADAATRAATVRLECDLLAVSGGWAPTIHLQSQRGVRPVYDRTIDAFVAAPDTDDCVSAGAVCGVASTVDAIAAGLRVGNRIAEQLGRNPVVLTGLMDRLGAAMRESPCMPLGALAHSNIARGKAFIDLQTDVTEADVALAHREGFVSVEHLKRYTTLGMGTDQGKTSNLNGLAAMARHRHEAPPAVGTTTFRPPYTPVAIGALAGAAVNEHFRPIRRTPMHEWHEAHGAQMTEVGLWMRPWFYRQRGTDVDAAYVYEMDRVRTGVGIVDVSTLGKIDVQGPDAGEFLDRVYVNGWQKLAVGRARYGVMLREDGFVFDDGTTSRLAPDHYFMTTTTANAAAVMSRLEFLLDTAWPDLRVQVTSATDQWGAMAVAGPQSRVLLSCVLEGDLSNEALPYMGCAAAQFDGVPVRVHRISFSGELAYEVYCPAGDAVRLWAELYQSGQALGVIAYGTEAMGALRVEKGHAAGPELDGRTTLDDLGLGRMAKASPFTGSVLRRRDDLQRLDRARLIGLKPENPAERLRPGCILFPEGGVLQGHGIGHVTSTTYSPTLKSYIALGMVNGGVRRQGQRLRAVYPLKSETVTVRVVDPVFLDPEGERLRG